MIELLAAAAVLLRRSSDLGPALAGGGMLLCGGGLFVGFIVLIIILGQKAQQKYEARLRAFADEMGLELNASQGSWIFRKGATVTGKFRGRNVKLDRYVVRHGKSSTTYMRLVVRPVEVGAASLSVSAEGFFAKIGKMVGMEDINVDGGWFDKKYLVRGSSPDFARQVLSVEEAREKISAVIDKARGEMKIEDRTAHWHSVGIHHEPQTLAVTLDALCDMADAADGGVSEES